MFSFVPGATIVALRNENGSYNSHYAKMCTKKIVALRNENGSYNGSSPAI